MMSILYLFKVNYKKPWKDQKMFAKTPKNLCLCNFKSCTLTPGLLKNHFF